MNYRLGDWLNFCILLSPFFGIASGWIYFANTGDSVQLHCQFWRSASCHNYVGSSEDSILWVYSSLPPDGDISPPLTDTSRASHKQPTTKPPWFHNFPLNHPIPLLPGGRRSVYVVNGEESPEIAMQIENIAWSDAGTYACYCKEEFPPIAVSIHQLVVFGRPYVIIAAFETGFHYAIPSTRIVSEQTNATMADVVVAPGSNVTLTCVYSNTIFPIRMFVWLKDGADFAVSPTDSSLQIIGMNRQLTGYYCCRVVLSDIFNSTGPSFRLGVPKEENSTVLVVVNSRVGSDSSAARNEVSLPITLIAVLACVIFFVILLSVLIVRTLLRQRQDHVRFTLPNSFNGS